MRRSIKVSRSAARGALAALLVMGCRAPGREGAAAAGNASGAPQAFPAADVAAIRAADSSFAAAVTAGNAAAVADVYEADAKLLPPNAPPIQGREGIQKFWGGFLGGYDVRITLASDEVDGRGDLGYNRGHYTLEGTPKAAGSAPLHDEGKFLEVLRKQPDGGWRYAVDMYSSNLPASNGK
jgi:ketosteroid isomerase-like protein